MLLVSPGSGQHFLSPLFPCSHWPMLHKCLAGSQNNQNSLQVACGLCSLFSGWLQTDCGVTNCHVTTSQNSWQAPSLRVTVTKERDSHQDIVNWILCLHFLSHDAEVRPPISVPLYSGLVTKGKLWWKCDYGLTNNAFCKLWFTLCGDTQHLILAYKHFS